MTITEHTADTEPVTFESVEREIQSIRSALQNIQKELVEVFEDLQPVRRTCEGNLL